MTKLMYFYVIKEKYSRECVFLYNFVSPIVSIILLQFVFLCEQVHLFAPSSV